MRSTASTNQGRASGKMEGTSESELNITSLIRRSRMNPCWSHRKLHREATSDNHSYVQLSRSSKVPAGREFRARGPSGRRIDAAIGTRGSQWPLTVDSHPSKLLIPLADEVFRGEAPELAQITQQIGLERVAHRAVIAMGTAQRLGDDVVDYPERGQVPGRQPECLGGQRLCLLVGHPPEDSCTPFR